MALRGCFAAAGAAASLRLGFWAAHHPPGWASAAPVGSELRRTDDRVHVAVASDEGRLSEACVGEIRAISGRGAGGSSSDAVDGIL